MATPISPPRVKGLKRADFSDDRSDYTVELAVNGGRNIEFSLTDVILNDLITQLLRLQHDAAADDPTKPAAIGQNRPLRMDRATGFGLGDGLPPGRNDTHRTITFRFDHGGIYTIAWSRKFDERLKRALAEEDITEMVPPTTH